jgi:hypothetical protein
MKYLSLIVVSLLILAACAAQEPSKAKQIAEDLKKQAAEPTAAPIAEPTAEPTKALAENVSVNASIAAVVSELPSTNSSQMVKSLTDDVKEETTAPAAQRTRMYKFLDAFAKNVKSYQFKFKTGKYYVKGTRYKVILEAPIIVKHIQFGDLEKDLFYYDTVYVDRSAKTAIAYCEGHKSQVNTQCTDLNLFDLAYPVSYKDYDIILPEDWLLANLDKEPVLFESNKYYVKGRASVFVRIETDPALELSIDPGTGLTMQADTKEGNQLISRNEYLDLVSNEVRDVDVQHRSKEEIPPSDAFNNGFYH